MIMLQERHADLKIYLGLQIFAALWPVCADAFNLGLKGLIIAHQLLLHIFIYILASQREKKKKEEMESYSNLLAIAHKLE